MARQPPGGSVTAVTLPLPPLTKGEFFTAATGKGRVRLNRVHSPIHNHSRA